MANFLYNGKPISEIIETGGPQNTVSLTDKYVPNASITTNFPPFFNSFHHFSSNRIGITVNVNYYVADTQIYTQNDVCAISAFNTGNAAVNTFPAYQTDPYPARTPTTPAPQIAAYQAAAPTWRTTTVYVSPNTNSGSINISNNPVYGKPNRAYFIIAGGGGGGGGSGRHPQLDARGGAGGGAGAVFSYLLYLTPNPAQPANHTDNAINYIVGGGGKRGLGGNSYYSPGFTLISGQKGGSGAASSLNYAGITYTANGGEGGDGGFGSWPQPLATGGVGGNFSSNAWSPTITPPTSPNTGAVNIAASGNAGQDAKTNSSWTGGNTTNDIANGGTRTWPLQSSRIGAYPIDNLGANRAKGGSGWLGQNDSGANDGAHGVLYLFFYYD